MQGARAPLPAAGMPQGAEPRIVPLDADIAIVVSDVPSSTYTAEALEPRLSDLEWVSLAGAAHHTVIDGIADAGVAVLPFRLFTIFSSEARAIKTLQATRDGLRAAFERVKGRQEWVLRIGRPDPSRVTASQQDEAARDSGTNFLQAKADARREALARAERVKVDVAAAFAALEAIADAAKTPPVDPTGNLLLDAAFLVSASRVEQMQQTLTDAAARLLRDGCPVSLTGPWPPYSFAAVEDAHDG